MAYQSAAQADIDQEDRQNATRRAYNRHEACEDSAPGKPTAFAVFRGNCLIETFHYDNANIYSYYRFKQKVAL